MNVTPYAINLSSTNSTRSSVFRARVVLQTDHSANANVGALPPNIPRGQVYYWTNLWQAGEAETLGELRAGGGILFDNPDAAVRWLLTDE